MERLTMTPRDLQTRMTDVYTHLVRGGEIVLTRYGRPIGVLSPYAETTPDGDASTELDTWHRMLGDGTDSPRDYVSRGLDVPADFDVDAITDEFTVEVNAVLPDGVTLHGRDVYGPYAMRQTWRDQLAEVREAIDGIDLDAIVKRHVSST